MAWLTSEKDYHKTRIETRSEIDRVILDIGIEVFSFWGVGVPLEEPSQGRIVIPGPVEIEGCLGIVFTAGLPHTDFVQNEEEAVGSGIIMQAKADADRNAGRLYVGESQCHPLPPEEIVKFGKEPKYRSSCLVSLNRSI
jgi:hypothetical protein